MLSGTYIMLFAGTRKHLTLLNVVYQETPAMNILLYGILMAGCEFCSYLNIDLIFPLINEIGTELAAPKWWSYWIFEVWLIAYCICSVIVALLNGKVSRVKLMFLSSISFIIGGFLFMIPNIWLTLLSKVFQGVATSFAIIIGCAFLHDSLSSMKAVRALSVIKSFIVIPPILAPLLSSFWFYKLQMPWRTLFGINVTLGCIFFIGMTLFLKKNAKKKSGQNHIEIAHLVKCIANKSFLTNVFTQNLIESPYYVWLTFAPVHCPSFLLHHTIVLSFSLLGLLASFFSSTRYNLNKVLRICTRGTAIISVIALFMQYILQYNVWEYMFIPTSFFALLYGIEVPILDRSIAISLKKEDKTTTIGLTLFINNAAFSSVVAFCCIFKGNGIMLQAIMSFLIIVASVIESKRVQTLVQH